jgi:hypothetical protein
MDYYEVLLLGILMLFFMLNVEFVLGLQLRCTSNNHVHKYVYNFYINKIITIFKIDISEAQA